MDLEDLRSSLTSEQFDALAAHVSTLEGKASRATQEAVSGRKTLKANLEQREAQIAVLLEKLGASSYDDVESMPTAAGQAAALKQFEAKLARMGRDLESERARADGYQTRHRDMLKKATLAEAVRGLDFFDADAAMALINSRMEWDGDEMFYRDGDHLIPVRDGVAALTKAKPHLLRNAAGGSGSGARSSQSGGRGHDAVKNPFDRKTWNVTEQMRLKRTDPDMAARLKAQVTDKE